VAVVVREEGRNGGGREEENKGKVREDRGASERAT